MAVELPPTEHFYHPILAHLALFREPVHRRDIFHAVADRLGLTEEQRSRLANDHYPSHEYRSGWSLSVLKKAGLLQNPQTGYWGLTEAGRGLVRQHPAELPPAEIEGINRVWWIKNDQNDIDVAAGTGQGRGLTPEQRKAVEEHAMHEAAGYLAANNWKFENTSAGKPYDYKATKGGREIVVEVKGTTGSGKTILLTANEVAVQREWHPNSALIVVHSIKLDRDARAPSASGGTLIARTDRQIDDDDLEVTAYQYRLHNGGA